MNDVEEKGIYVITHPSEHSSAKNTKDVGAAYGKGKGEDHHRSFLPTKFLRQQVSVFLNVIEEAFSSNSNRKSEFELEEIEFSLDIDASGKISLLGSGVEFGSTGGIHLKFKRSISGNGTNDK